MFVAELVSQLDMLSLKVSYVEQGPPQLPNNFSNPSVTPLVSQPLMSPYVAAAVSWSLHHARTAVLILSLVMRVSVGLGLGASDEVGIELGAIGLDVGAGDAVGIELGANVILGTGVVLGDTLGATDGDDEDDDSCRSLSLSRFPNMRNGLRKPPLNATLLPSNESTTAI